MVFLAILGKSGLPGYAQNCLKMSKKIFAIFQVYRCATYYTFKVLANLSYLVRNRHLKIASKWALGPPKFKNPGPEPNGPTQD